MRATAALLLLLAGIATGMSAHAQELPRKVLILWDSSVTTRWRETFAHLMLEMPLNRLGYVVEPVDVAKPMPPVSVLDGARAIVAWLEADTVPDARAAFAFIDAASTRGLHFVQIGDPAFLRSRDGRTNVALAEANRVFSRAGFRLAEDFVRLTFDVEVLKKEPALVEYERPLDRLLPPFPVWRPADSRTRSLLVLRRRGQPDTESHVIMIGPGGGLASFGYSHFYEPELRRRQWRIDPFAFLAEALGAGGGPVPDVTTIAGRRIFFSQIDGDGWRNVTEIEPWKRRRKLSSEVILDEVLRAYPDLPVTVAPVVADLHPDWCGSDETRSIARRMFALPNVEAGSHTWTHPLDWGFFDALDVEAKERPFLRRYPGCRSEPSRIAALIDRIKRKFTDLRDEPDSGEEFDGQYGTIGSYNTPRSFAKRPFSIHAEIDEAAAYLTTLAPPGRGVPIVQWSGNTLPFEAVLAATRKAGLRNINGGDTRYDSEYDSVSYVAPIGRRVGAERQIYAAGSNENTYTDLWSDRYFGFRSLRETFERTGAPRRLVPVDLYYHIYSGEKEPALKALIGNVEWARSHELAPIRTSQYAAIAEGFYSARIVREGAGTWRILDRGALQTIRFDPPLDTDSVDLERSSGVIGFRNDAGALYVALDPAVAEAVVTLGGRAPAGRPSLRDSRWPVRGLQVTADGFTFETAGFGPGEMRWRAVPDADYVVTPAGGEPVAAKAGRDGTLQFVLPPVDGESVHVSVNGPVR